jgi:hypothetical protein
MWRPLTRPRSQPFLEHTTNRGRGYLGRALAYAAALRVARFGIANEHSDWGTAHHVVTYANAIHQSLKRASAAERPTLLKPSAVSFTAQWRSFSPDI